MKIILTLFFSFLFTSIVFSQKDRILINGEVMQFEKTVKDVHILNLNTNKGTISDQNGLYKISVQLNDTLQISHIEYKLKKIVINEKHLRLKYLTISIEIMTNYLTTVNIKKHNLTGNLLIDTNNTPDTIPKAQFDPLNFQELAKMPSFKNYGIDFEKPPINDVNPIKAGGLTAMMLILDKENILRRKLRQQKNTHEKIINEFGKKYLTDELKIPQDKIYNFITYCNSRNILQLYLDNKILEVLTILNEESIEYNKR